MSDPVGTAGAVQYYVNSSTFGGDKDKLFLDTSNVRLGIGTDSPATTLHISAAVPEFRLTDSDGGYATVQASTGNLEICADDGDNQSNSYIAFQIDNSEKVRFLNDGTVGINETAPTSTNSNILEVKSSANATTSAIRTTNKDTSAGTDQGAALDFGLSRNSGAFKPQAGKIAVRRALDWTADDANIDAFMTFSVYENNALSEKMRINAGGGVGIGTAGSYNGLHIKPASGNGQLVVEKASGASSSINSQTSLVQIGTISNHPLQLTANSTAYVHITTAGNVGIGSTSPSGKLEVNTGSGIAYFTRTAGDDGSSNPAFGIAADSTKPLLRAYGDGLVFETAAVGGTASERLRIDSSGTLILAGSGGSATNSLDFSYNGVSGQASINADSNGGNTYLTFGTSASGSLTERMRIDSDGALTSTSTSTDAAFLKSSHANNTNVYINNTNATTGNTANLYFGPANDVGGAKISAIATEDFSTSANRSADLALSTRNNGNWVEAMRIDSSGNVGIGATPSDLFHLSGSSPVIRGHDTDGGSAKINFGAGNITLDADFAAGESSSLINFKVDGTERMRIASDGNVGIGSTTPARLLELSADTNSTVDLFRLTNADTTYSQTVDFSLDTNKDLVITGGSGNGGIHFNMGSRGYTFSNGDITVERASAANMSVTSTGSTANLTVQGGEANIATIKLNSDDGDDASDITILEQSNGGPFKIKTNNGGSTAISCDSGGNVAIKQATASYALDVNGVVNCTSLRFADGTSISTTPTGTVLLRDLNPAAFNYDMHVAGKVGIGNTSPSERLHIKETTTTNSYAFVENTTTGNAGLKLKNSQGQWAIVANDSLRFLDVDSGTQPLTITSAGNVGIGTTSPSSTLHLKASPYPTLRLEDSDSGQYALIYSNNDDLYISADHGNTGGASNLVFNVDTTERMRINSSGNVGIGTTSPTFSSGIGLHIKNSTRANLRIETGSNRCEQFIDGLNFYLDHDPAGAIVFRNSTRTTRMVIAAGGNVGIGAISPLSALHIRKAANLGTNFQEPRNGDTAIRFDIPNYHNNVVVPMLEAASNNNDALPPAVRIASQFTNSGSKLIFGTTNSYSNGVNNNALSIGHDARVGINHTTPGATLDIYKSPLYSTNTVILRRADNNSKYAIWNYNTATCHFGTHANDNLGFITNNATHMTITSAGNVGVGTTSPSYKLDVDGTVRCSTLIFTDGTSFSSVGQVGNKAIAVNIGNGTGNVVGRAQSVVNASYGGIQNGLVLVYYYYHYHSRCGNGGCTRTAYAKNAYQVTDGNWTSIFGF